MRAHAIRLHAGLREGGTMSASSCFERVRRLRERGVITGYTALIDPKFAERELLIFIEVLLDRTTSDIFDQFAERIGRSPEVLECHMVAGCFDNLVKVPMRDMAAYRAFLAGAQSVMPGVRETRTYAVMEEVKDTSVLAVANRRHGASQISPIWMVEERRDAERQTIRSSREARVERWPRR